MANQLVSSAVLRFCSSHALMLGILSRLVLPAVTFEMFDAVDGDEMPALKLPAQNVNSGILGVECKMVAARERANDGAHNAAVRDDADLGVSLVQVLMRK